MLKRTEFVTFYVCLCLGVLLTSNVGIAQQSANNSASTTTIAPQKVEKAWSFAGNIARSTNLYDYQDGSRGDSLDFQGILGIKLSENYSTKAIIAYSQDLKMPEGSDWGDTALVLAHKPMPMNKNLNWTPSVSLLAPTSKDSHTRQNMLFAAGTGVAFGFNEGVLVQGLSLSTSISLSRLVHQYETAIDGRVNTQYSSKQTISGGYEFGHFSVSVEFVHKNGMTYQGNLKEAFEHTEELGYSMNDHLGFALGHTLAGSALKANGEDSNIALMNDNESKVYGSMSVSF